MPENLILTLIFQMIIVGYSPGPANIFAFSCSIRSSKKDTLLSWLGLVCGFTISMILLTLMIHFIGEIMGKYAIYLKYVGGLYMAYLAYVLWKSRINMSKVRTGTFLNGLIVQLTNAKMMMFELTIFSTFVLPYSTRYIDLFKVGCMLYIAGPIGNLFWILLGRFLKKLFDRYQMIIDGICAILLLLCAIYIVFY